MPSTHIMIFRAEYTYTVESVQNNKHRCLKMNSWRRPFGNLSMQYFLPMSSKTDEEDIYDVEAILDDRIYNGEKQYLIKWVGWDKPSDNTWESECNVLCDELKNEYEARKKAAKPSKKSPLRPKKFKDTPTNEWEDKIKEIVNVVPNNDGRLEVEYLMHNGKRGVCMSDEIHRKAPIKLLNFYEAHLSFTE